MKRSGTLTSIITVVGGMDMWLGPAIPASMTGSQATAASCSPGSGRGCPLPPTGGITQDLTVLERQLVSIEQWDPQLDRLLSRVVRGESKF